MKQISFWAKEHPCTARLIIIACYVGLNITGIFTGHLLNELYINLSPLFFFAVIIIFLLGLIVYPSRTLRGTTLSEEAFYIRQKSCDLILTSATFLMIVYCGNHLNGLPFNYTMSQAAIQPNPITPTKKSNEKAYKSIEEFKASMKNEQGKTWKWKERKKLLKAQIRAIKKAPELSKEMKILLTILCVFAASAFFYFVAALSCSLACSGAQGLGLLVAVGGIVGGCLLIGWADRAIWGKWKKKQLPKDLVPPEKNTVKMDNYN